MHDITDQRKERAWKLLVLLWRMLLHRPSATGRRGKEEFARRLEGARANARPPTRNKIATPRTAEQAMAAQIEKAVALVRQGAPSKARQLLTAAALAPGNAQTLAELRDPARRPPSPTEGMPEQLRRSQPPTCASLEKRIFAETLRSAPKNSSGAAANTRSPTTLQPKLGQHSNSEAKCNDTQSDPSGRTCVWDAWF